MIVVLCELKISNSRPRHRPKLVKAHLPPKCSQNLHGVAKFEKRIENKLKISVPKELPFNNKECILKSYLIFYYCTYYLSRNTVVTDFSF